MHLRAQNIVNVALEASAADLVDDHILRAHHLHRVALLSAAATDRDFDTASATALLAPRLTWHIHPSATPVEDTSPAPKLPKLLVVG